MKWTEEAVYAPAFADLAETDGTNTEKVFIDCIVLGFDLNGLKESHILTARFRKYFMTSSQFSLMENDYVWGDRKVG